MAPREQDIATNIPTNDLPKVGFIGCGTIAVAIATGLATAKPPVVSAIAVSRRNKQKSSELAARFPDLVTVYDDNQDILEESETVFLSVLPAQVSTVMEPLQFDEERHHLVSVVATAKLADVVAASKMDAAKVTKLICLPSIAHHQGVALHCCPTPDPLVTDLLKSTGSVITVPNEAEMEACMVPTCLMGPTYGILKQSRDWLLEHTTSLSTQDAASLVAQLYLGTVQDAARDCDTNPNRLEDLIAEQTPGGVNEQALANLTKLGGLQAHSRVMDGVLSRIRGETDGSISS